MERRHYQRILSKAIEEASVGLPPKRNWQRPVAIGVSVLLVGALVWFFVSKVLPDPDRISGARRVTVADGEDGGEVELANLRQLAVDFVNAETMEKILSMVENPDINESRIQEFLDARGEALPLGGHLQKILRVDFEGSPVYEVLVDGLFGSPSVLPIRAAGENGEFLVNWEWASGWTEADWDTLIAEKWLEPVVAKVFVERDDYYNYEYRDEKKWQSVRISDKSAKKFVYGFIERSNPTLKILEPYNGLVPMTIEVKFAPGQAREIVEVSKIHKIGWVFDVGE